MAKIVFKFATFQNSDIAYGGLLPVIVTELLTLQMMYSICLCNEFYWRDCKNRLENFEFYKWKELIPDYIPHFACYGIFCLGLKLQIYTMLHLIIYTEFMLSEKWHGRQYRSSNCVGDGVKCPRWHTAGRIFFFKLKLRYFQNGKLAQFTSRLLSSYKINRFVQITQLCNWSWIIKIC